MLTEKIKLDTDEKILKAVHKHWFILFTRIFGIIFFAFLPLIIIYIFPHIPFLIPHVDNFVIYISYILFFYLAYLLIIWMILFNIWTDHYLDTWIVTNKRVIVIDQRGLFSRTSGSFRLERLQDLNIEMHGIIETFLNFGTIQAQTAGGNEEEFKGYGFPSPRELKALITKSADERIKTMSRDSL